MSLTGKTPFKMYRPLALNASGDGVAVTTLSGNMTMTALDEQLQVLDGGGSSRNVTLPTADPELKGVFYIISNAGSTNNLVVKDGGSTIATLNPSEQGIFAQTATAWKVCLTTSSTASDIYSNNGAFTGNNTHSGTETFSNAAGVSTDVITERTGATGVTVDGVLLKDNAVTASGGVTANLTGNVTGDVTGNVTGNVTGSAGSCTGNAATATTATTGNSIAAASVYASVEQTGTGGEQIFAHGLGTTPAVIWHAITEAPAALGGGLDVAYGVMSSTELRFTVTSGIKFRIWAIK